MTTNLFKFVNFRFWSEILLVILMLYNRFVPLLFYQNTFWDNKRFNQNFSFYILEIKYKFYFKEDIFKF